EADSSPMLVGSADLLIVQGDLNIHSMVQLAFANVADTPASFSPGTIFSLINYVGTWNGGLFYRGTNALEEGEEFFMGQNYWVINYEEATGGLNFTEDYVSGGRFVTLTATAIPEPSTAILAASTTFLLLRRRRAELSQLRQ
nr:hypothetical protein [Akkermansiaceae bacterium]